MVMFEAERLARIVAPASAPADEGGTAAQKSSRDLHVEDETVEVARLEDQVGPERDVLPAHPDRLPHDVAALGEPSLLVILPVVGQEALRHHPEQSAARDRQRAIVEPSRTPQRRAYQQDRRQTGACGRDVRDGVLDGVEERGLQEEVVDGVGGDAELGKDRQVHPRRIRAPGLLEDGVAVVADVGRAHARRACRHPDEAMPVHGHEVLAALPVVHACLAHSAPGAPQLGNLCGGADLHMLAIAVSEEL